MSLYVIPDLINSILKHTGQIHVDFQCPIFFYYQL